MFNLLRLESVDSYLQYTISNTYYVINSTFVTIPKKDFVYVYILFMCIDFYMCFIIYDCDAPSSLLNRTFQLIPKIFVSKNVHILLHRSYLLATPILFLLISIQRATFWNQFKGSSEVNIIRCYSKAILLVWLYFVSFIDSQFTPLLLLSKRKIIR